MKRSSGFVAVVVVALVAAVPAAAQSPSPQQLTGGQALPAAEQGFVEAMTGKAGATTVPNGWTILAWNTPVTAGTPVPLSVQCPAGTLVADLEPGDPMAPITAEYSPSDFISVYGTAGFRLSATPTPGQPSGTASLTVACLPKVRVRSTRVTGRSPVTFPKTQTFQALRKGARIPRSWRLYKSVTTGPISRYGAVGATGHLCPAGTQTFTNPVFQPRRRGTVLVSNGFVLAPGQPKGPVTAYTLCSTFQP